MSQTLRDIINTTDREIELINNDPNSFLINTCQKKHLIKLCESFKNIYIIKIEDAKYGNIYSDYFIGFTHFNFKKFATILEKNRYNFKSTKIIIPKLTFLLTTMASRFFEISDDALIEKFKKLDNNISKILSINAGYLKQDGIKESIQIRKNFLRNYSLSKFQELISGLMLDPEFRRLYQISGVWESDDSTIDQDYFQKYNQIMSDIKLDYFIEYIRKL